MLLYLFASSAKWPLFFQGCVFFFNQCFFFFFSPTLIHLSNLGRRQRKEVVEERRVSESERAPAPAGVNICFRNLNNRPPVICISDNGQPYGSVDPHCAEVLALAPLTHSNFSLLSLSSFFHFILFFLFFLSFFFLVITFPGTFCSFTNIPSLCLSSIKAWI